VKRVVAAERLALAPGQSHQRGLACSQAPLRTPCLNAHPAPRPRATPAIQLLPAQGDYDAVVTGPIAKSAWHAAGHVYPGQTEYLAERAGAKEGEYGMVSGRPARAAQLAHRAAQLPGALWGEGGCVGPL
jgi:hypothetical protein